MAKNLECGLNEETLGRIELARIEFAQEMGYLIDAARKSRVLTAEDYGITVNARRYNH